MTGDILEPMPPDRQRFESMVLESYNTPRFFNIAAALSSWTLLAGFIVLPGTFTSLKALRVHTQAGETFHSLIDQIPLLCLSAICCAAGVMGTILLWIRFRHNPVWLLSNLFGWVCRYHESGEVTNRRAVPVS